MLPTKFQVNWPFGSGEEANNRFSRWRPWRPSWISDRNDFSFFFFYKSLSCFQPSYKSICLMRYDKLRKIDFEDGSYGGNLGFPF